jgi:phytoene synthase
MASWQEPVQQQLRERDSDLYLASLFVPEAKRSAVQALYLFCAEVSRIPFLVSEAALGEIRLQWWHDTVEAIFHGDAQDNPAAQGLAAAIEAGDLPKFALQNLIKAHEFDLYSDPMPSLNDLEGYLGETHATVIRLAGAILNYDEALLCAEATGLAGVAYGLASLLRELPRWLAQQSNFIPADMMAARGIDPAKFQAPEFEAARGVVIAELREHARARLLEARKVMWTVTSDVKPAFLPVALTEAYLEAIRKVGQSLASRPVNLMQWRKQWILWKAARSESF